MPNIRKSVFGSRSERNLYATLTSRWSNRFNVYPNLPFLNIIEVKKNELPVFDFEVLKKSSVDYTLCTKDDAPVLSIEFDGLGYGFSRDGKYVPVVYDIPDPYRQEKMNRKLRAADKANYPLVILSYFEKEPIGKDLQITLVDGIIGQILSRRRFDELMNERLKEEPDILSRLSKREMDDLIDGIEIEADFEENPLSRKAAIAEVEAVKRGLLKRWSFHYFEEPTAPDLLSWPPDPESLSRRIDALRNAEWIGARIVSDTPSGIVLETAAKIRSISGHGVSPLILVEDIVRLLHATKLLDDHTEEIPNRTST